ncbi:MAG: FYDLN acid domain-containing protein [Myxococcota bacterium]|nr:FYDLN acid domain-containing protein [Myxococcota bacterium]
MSPTKKSAKKKPAQANKKAAAKQKAAAKKKAAAVATSRKKVAAVKKKAAAAKKKTAAIKKKAAAIKKKEAAKKTAAAAKKKAEIDAARKKVVEAKKAAALEAKKKAEAEKRAKAAETARKKEEQAQLAAQKKLDKARAKVPPPTGPQHPTRGYKYECFGCGLKFYDMNRPEPTCPTCNEDQRDRPVNARTPTPAARKARAVRPMAPLLDEDETELRPGTGEEGDEGPAADERTPDPAGAIFDDVGTATETDET